MLLALSLALALPGAAFAAPAQDNDKAVAAVWAREGEYWSALAKWQAASAMDLSPADRARVLARVAGGGAGGGYAVRSGGAHD